MFILKGCPKCKGDLAAETGLRQLDGDDDVSCIQCGYALRPEESRTVFGRLMQRPVRLQPAYARVRRA